MYLEENITDTNTKDKSTPIPVWNEYNHYHDYFTKQLSYNRRTNYTRSNVWDFEYV